MILSFDYGARQSIQYYINNLLQQKIEKYETYTENIIDDSSSTMKRNRSFSYHTGFVVYEISRNIENDHYTFMDFIMTKCFIKA